MNCTSKILSHTVHSKWLLILNQDNTASNGYVHVSNPTQDIHLDHANIGITIHSNFRSDIADDGVKEAVHPQSDAYNIIGALKKEDYAFQSNGRYQLRLIYNDRHPLTDGSVYDEIWTQTSWYSLLSWKLVLFTCMYLHK